MPDGMAEIRKNYQQKKLMEENVDLNPFKQFEYWWQDAIDAKVDEVNAMTLATASMDAVPSARTVLLKGFSEQGFIFFSNYNSYKGQQLAENPKACLVFFWKELERQIRITGLVMKLNNDENDNYFYSRPFASQVGAVASPQSQVIESRQWLDDKFNRLEQELNTENIQRPPHWGGYIVRPVIIEFWQGRPGRLHDRLQYTLEENGNWKIERLAP